MYEKKIDLVFQDEFTEEGFKITSHMIMTRDLNETIQDILTRDSAVLRVFENKIAGMMHKVMYAICINTDIPVNAIEGKIE